MIYFFFPRKARESDPVKAFMIAMALFLIAGCVAPAAKTSSSSSTSAPTQFQEAKSIPMKTAANATAQNRTSVVASLHLEGQTPAAITPPYCIAQIGDCVGLIGGENDLKIFFEYGNDTTSFNLTLSWQAATPLTEKLQIWIDKLSKWEDTEFWYFNPDECLEVIGTSPLVIAGGTSNMGDGPLGVWIQVPYLLAEDPVYLQPSTNQPFVLDGAVTFLR